MAVDPTQRRRLRTAISATVVIVVLLVVLVAVELHRGSQGPVAAPVAAPTTLVGQVTAVPATTFEQVGRGSTVGLGVPVRTTGAPLTSAGKPEVLFVGAEFCPFCAAQRWAVVAALSRFGTFHGLSEIRSHEYSISTFSFRSATYTSRYVSFAGREYEDQRGHKLQPLTPAQSAQWNTYLAPKTSRPGFPFLSFGGQYVSYASMVDPNVVLGRSWDQIAAPLSDPTSTVGKAIVGPANYMTAVICRTTGNQPADVCTPAITGLANGLATYQH